ncbi:MAG TPA: hypothetical protein VJ276_11450 [Thermoanaerobaculia bacterium]|nr:hypothetical protein [Thermoanaerobaculia bacterium]
MSDLQFDRAEYAQPAPSAVVCSSCQQSIIDNYYTLGADVFCARCREQQEHQAEGWGGIRLGRALVAGLAAAIAGSVVYWGIRAATEMEFGLISIAVGFCVGKAVMWGSRGRGGLAYQLLAVFLTYASIVGNYIPDIVQEVQKRQPEQAQQAPQTQQANVVKADAAQAPSAGGLLLAFGALMVIAFMMPFFTGTQNIIGLLIIGFGLWQAWKGTRRRDVFFEGPFGVAPAAK